MFTENVLIQMFAVIGAIAATIFGAIRYTVKTSAQRENNLLKYFETKNGHMERMASDFTATSREFAATVKDLAVEVRVLNDARRKRKK